MREADVVVIGAGAAGLAAARSLARQWARVVLLEARDRIGGRVWSLAEPRAATPVELGAEFIHGKALNTMALLREAGMKPEEVGGESFTRTASGELRREERDFQQLAQVFDGARSLAKDESVDEFLKRFEHDQRERQSATMARMFVEGFDAADPAIASARSIADEWRSGVDWAIARPLGGYGRLFEHLHKSCEAAGVRLSLSTVARRITWQRGAVIVHASARGESQTIRARAAIITLPVGVLRHQRGDSEVPFDPPLPAATRAALSSIETGHVLKVALWFRTAYWETLHNGRYRDAGFFRAEGQPFSTYWTQLPERSNVIIAWAGGPKATALAGATHAELLKKALDGFGALFDEAALANEEFDGGAMHDWGPDPFARGAYSYVAVGGADSRAALATPVDDTLFFAGEATATDGQGGTVSGAFETGQRAAAEVAKRYA